MFAKAISGTTALLALSSFAAAAPQKRDNDSSSGLSLSQQVRIADTSTERYQLLPNDEDFVYTFTEEAPIADGASFPPFVGTGMSFTMGPLPPCTMSLIHIHPRAAEIFAVYQGTIEAEMIPELGAVDAEGNPRVIRTNLTANDVTIFPQGAFHTQFNPECEPAGIAVAFNSEDIGFSAVAGQLFGFDADIITPSFGGSIGGEDIDSIREKIPLEMGIRIDQCLDKCNMEKRRV